MAGVTQTAVRGFRGAWLYFTHTDEVVENPGNTFYFGNHNFLSFQREILWDF